MIFFLKISNWPWAKQRVMRLDDSVKKYSSPNSPNSNNLASGKPFLLYKLLQSVHKLIFFAVFFFKFLHLQFKCISQNLKVLNNGLII
jgi:hypothetical protein